MLDAHSLRAYPVPPLALLPLFTEIREGFFSETGLPIFKLLGSSVIRSVADPTKLSLTER
jgi:hypothetical protein